MDVERFARSSVNGRSAEAATAVALHADITGPRLAYLGVIDDRIDLQLLDELATRRPDWSVVMVGPTVKIDPARVPRRANVDWPGMATYNLLPHWDVASMPFALNAATRFISPTKTLEYLAG